MRDDKPLWPPRAGIEPFFENDILLSRLLIAEVWFESDKYPRVRDGRSMTLRREATLTAAIFWLKCED